MWKITLVILKENPFKLEKIAGNDQGGLNCHTHANIEMSDIHMVENISEDGSRSGCYY